MSASIQKIKDFYQLLVNGNRYVSCDYGTQNATVFLLWNKGTNGKWYCIREYYYSGRDKGKWQALTDDKLSEADKLAKMTKEEKAQYMQNKKEKELSDREAAVTRSELMAEAKNNLSDEGLPVELAEVLNYTDADACKKSMETVKKAFQTAVEKAVDEKLKGGKPPKKAPETNTQEALEKQVYNAMMGIF